MKYKELDDLRQRIKEHIEFELKDAKTHEENWKILELKSYVDALVWVHGTNLMADNSRDKKKKSKKAA